VRVTAQFFHVLGVPPLLGRAFLPEEETAGKDHEVVLSYPLWQRRFSGDSAIIGKQIPVDGESYIVGVMPRAFEFQFDSAEATDRLEARTAATLANTGKQVQSLFTLVHAQIALTNSLLQYVLTCVVEPPEEVLPAARARAKARYAKILRLAGQEVATRNQATLEQVLEHSKQQ
jgi:MacB-like periplasmic core domain